MEVQEKISKSVYTKDNKSVVHLLPAEEKILNLNDHACKFNILRINLTSTVLNSNTDVLGA